MNRRDSSFCIVVALVVATLLWGDAALADDLLAQGTDEMFWVARVVPAGPTSAPGEHTLIRGRAVGAEAGWVTVARPASRVVALANRGTELAALFESGDWMLLWQGGRALGALPDDGAKLLMLASGPDSIWSIAGGGRATASTTSITPATEPSGAAPHGELGLYKLERGKWLRQSWLPADVTAADAGRISMTVAGSVPLIAILQFGGSIRTLRWEQNRWVEIPPVGALEVRQIELISNGGRPILWAAADTGAGRLHFLAAEWSAPRALEMKDAPRAGEPRTIAIAANNIRLLFIRDRRIFEQTFDPHGAALREATPLPAAPAVPDTTPNRIITLAAAIMLMIVVLGSLRRGGGAAPASAAVAAGLIPAPLLLRFIAGVIDAAPLLIPCLFIFKDLDPSRDDIEALVAATSWWFYASLGAYLLYTWICEALFGRTLGKLLFGMRVVALDGAAPSARAIFARNALRLVDVTMLAIPLVLVILSPLRQRVGDIAARTVVVSGKAPSVDPTESSKEIDEQR